MLQETAGDGGVALEVGRSFAPEDAARIHEVIQRAAPGTTVEIDFRHVRDCQDYALALLARDLVGARTRVAVRGMSQHQQRILGYFGVENVAEDALDEVETR